MQFTLQDILTIMTTLGWLLSVFLHTHFKTTNNKIAIEELEIKVDSMWKQLQTHDTKIALQEKDFVHFKETLDEIKALTKSINEKVWR